MQTSAGVPKFPSMCRGFSFSCTFRPCVNISALQLAITHSLASLLAYSLENLLELLKSCNITPKPLKRLQLTSTQRLAVEMPLAICSYNIRGARMHE